MYIPRMLANMIWATTKDSTSVSFGLGHRCIKHNTTFNLNHLVTCCEIQGCKDIAKYAKKIKDSHILEWNEEERTDAILQYTSLTVQMQNLTAQHRAKIEQVEIPKYEKTGGKRGRPRGTDKIAKTNHKVSDYYKKDKKLQGNASLTVPTGRADDVEMIDTSSVSR